MDGMMSRIIILMDFALCCRDFDDLVFCTLRDRSDFLNAETLRGSCRWDAS